MRDEIGPFSLDAAFLAAVVEEGGGEGCGDGEEDEPVAGGKAEFQAGEACGEGVKCERSWLQ